MFFQKTNQKDIVQKFFTEPDTKNTIQIIIDELDSMLTSCTEKKPGERYFEAVIPYLIYIVRIRVNSKWIYAIVDSPNVDSSLYVEGFWRTHSFFGLDYIREEKRFDFIRYITEKSMYNLIEKKEILETYLKPIMWRIVALNEVFEEEDIEKNKFKIEKIKKINEIKETKKETDNQIEKIKKLNLDTDIQQQFEEIFKEINQIKQKKFNEYTIFEEHNLKLLLNGDLFKIAKLYNELTTKEKEEQKQKIIQLLSDILKEIKKTKQNKEISKTEQFEMGVKLFEKRYLKE